MSQMFVNPATVQLGLNDSQKIVEEKANKYHMGKFVHLLFISYVWKTIMILAAIYAAYLSWKCSGYKGSVMWRRVISAMIAAMFNIVYVVYYYVARSDICFIIKKVSGLK